MQLLYRENVPVNQNLLYKTIESAKNAATGTLDIQCDESTGFIYNKAFNVELVKYTSDYNNNQCYSPFFDAYIDNQIDWLIQKYLYNASTIVEVGCGKGDFLKRLAIKLPSCKFYGFDTSYIQNPDTEFSNLQIFNKYFDKNHLNFQPDAVICRHVIEHIDNPANFLTMIRESIPDNALLFLETPDVNWILKNVAIYDFFYEHCSYFNQYSISKALNVAGFDVIEILNEFEGQYMWVVAKASNISFVDNNSCNDYDYITEFDYLMNKYADYVSERETAISKTASALQRFKKSNKKIAVWGAGAKGTSFVNLFDKDRELVEYIVDINKNKQGKYVGKSGHKVVGEDEIAKNDIEVIYVMNENYLDEIKVTLDSDFLLSPEYSNALLKTLHSAY